MVKLFSVAEMRKLEQEADASGLSYGMMMENAGKGIAEEIKVAYSHLTNKKIVAIIGSGNNGGDALVALYYLAGSNWDTFAYLVRPRNPGDPLVKRLDGKGGLVFSADEDDKYKKLGELIHTCPVLLDGVLGTGIKLPLGVEIAKVLSFAKHQIEKTEGEIHVIAVDCPSGVDCDTGESAPETLPAEMTVTMAGMKIGLVRFPAASLAGEVRVGSIGHVEKLLAYTKNKKIIIDPGFVRQALPRRPADSHKGTFGTAFIIAGSLNYTGAALLSGLAAYRVGAGLVTMAVPAPLHEALAGQFPESTWVLLPHDGGVISADAAQVVLKSNDRATALMLGPGFGLEDTTREFINRLISVRNSQTNKQIGFLQTAPAEVSSRLQVPMVLDADGLKLLTGIEHWNELLPPCSVLTPHPGEMSALTGLTVGEIQANRIQVAENYSAEWGHVIVLKGAYTVIADPEGNIAVIPVASAALAKAGTGDVLAGLIVGLRAQGVDGYTSACAGAWIHAQAGLLAEKRLGNSASVIARDILSAVPQVITDLNEPEN